MSGNERSSRSRKSNDARITIVIVIELPGDEPAAVSPVEQAVTAALGDAVELRYEAADVGASHTGQSPDHQPSHTLTAAFSAPAGSPRGRLQLRC